MNWINPFHATGLFLVSFWSTGNQRFPDVFRGYKNRPVTPETRGSGKETLAQVFFIEFCEISKNTLSYRTPPVSAFWTLIKIKMTESIHVLPCFCLVFLFLSLKMYCLVKYQIIENFLIFWWLHDPGLPCRDETSTCSAETDFTLRLHGEVKFHSGRVGHFSTWYLLRFVFYFLLLFFCKHC